MVRYVGNETLKRYQVQLSQFVNIARQMIQTWPKLKHLILDECVFQGVILQSEQQQVANFEKSGHSIHKLDQHIQLKVFLYTMFAVERSEGG